MAHFCQHQFLCNCIKILENNNLGGERINCSKVKKADKKETLQIFSI